jgi:hypothetical protein
LQASHSPLHALLQQNPSTQKPLAHSAAAAHAEPICLPAVQVDGVTHTPFGPQVSQGPLHARSQQTPETQNPVAQMPGEAHVVPLGSPHSPVGPHTFGCVQVASLGAVMTVQTPRLAPSHRMHVPQLADSQQTPSVQLPVSQVAALVHESPRTW